MPNIQVKNVPDEIHAKLRDRAAERHQSLQEFILQTLIEVAKTPTDGELFERYWADMRDLRGDRPPSAITTADILEILDEGSAGR